MTLYYGNRRTLIASGGLAVEYLVVGGGYRIYTWTTVGAGSITF
jgi:hypothetical protein